MAFYDAPSTFYDSGIHYDEPPVPPNQPPAKLKRMKRNTYYPSKSADQVIWLENFRNKLPGYASALGLTTPQRDAAVADARWLVYVLGSWLPAVRAFAPACTDAATLAQTGDGSALMVLSVFTASALPAGVVAVNTGALNRIFALVQIMKEASGFSEGIGTDLGVIGSAQTAPDLSTIQPVIDASLMSGHVDITWGWGGNGAFLDMLELQVDRGTGWGPLAFDTTPNYTDTAAFPATPTRWKYRAIYRVSDAQVGQWSAEASVMVGG